MSSIDQPDFQQDTAEQQKIKYLIMDFIGNEPVVIAEKITDDPDAFVEEFEESTGRTFEDNPKFALVTEDRQLE